MGKTFIVLPPGKTTDRARTHHLCGPHETGLRADVANSLLMDCEATYNRVALGLKSAEKSRFKYMQQQATRLKYAAKDATKTMYDLDMEAYYDDSDRLQEFLLLLIDRTAANEARFDMALHSIERMKSILGLYPKPQKKEEGIVRLLRGK